MSRKRASKNYTIQLFRIGPDGVEIDLLAINFRAESLAAAQAQANRDRIRDPNFIRPGQILFLSMKRR
jgi:hypothetical protein